MVVEFHYIIYGKVRGVGFRYFVFDKANNLDIKGFVQNTPNGNVEVLAQHNDRKILDEFEDNIRIGPQLSHVEKIKKEITEKPIKRYTDFLII